MRREGKYNILTNKTIRYGGNVKDLSKYQSGNLLYLSKYQNENKKKNNGLHTVRNIVHCIFRNESYQLKIGDVGYCLKCGGSRFSCKGLPYEQNQYSSKKYRENKKKNYVKYLINEYEEFEKYY